MGARRRLRYIAAVTMVLALIGTALGVAPRDSADAADLTQFRPGLIISDAVFYNAQTMDEAAIQAFLDSKVPWCQAGYTCLRDYVETTSSRTADVMCSAYAGAANESAARIIAKVSRACGINPQVILATLQKENSLVTSTAPTSGRYRTAMGYACPDTAACDSRYYGFFNQVYSAAWQFIRYSNPPGTSQFFTWYPVGRVTNVLFHPNSACGSSPVLIENNATAALYYYTPYQPNAAALAAGYSASADPCSSYGNRNFFQFFSDWFGSPFSVGESAIDFAYNSAGGAAVLGAATTGYVTQSVNGGGIVRGYENGAIAWSAPRGAWVLTGDFRTYFNEAGGLAGSLGWPTSNVVDYDVGAGGRVQGFMGGAIVHTERSGFVILDGEIRTTYGRSGGLTGPLGWPISPQQCTSDTCSMEFENGIITVERGQKGVVSIPAIVALHESLGGASGSLGPASGDAVAQSAHGGGYVQVYRNGVIVSSAQGTYVLEGAIRSAFGATGGLAGYLGWPTSGPVCESGTCTQSFMGGRVRVVGSGGVEVMHGEILEAYEAAGGATGPLGSPVGSSIRLAASGGGYVQPFASGVITWSSAVGAAVLQEPIRSVFNAVGGLSGKLGWPTTGANQEPANGGGTVQGFQNGAIASSASGTHVIDGAIRAHYGTEGGLAGRLGWPTSGERAEPTNGGGRVQGFQNGAIVHRPATGALTLAGEIRSAYNRAGGLTGSLGWPTSAERSEPANGGGTVQGFQNGAIASSPAGTFILRGGIRTTFNANGGLVGPLGWPASEATCNVGATACEQLFQGGSISWTSSAGGSVSLD